MTTEDSGLDVFLALTFDAERKYLRSVKELEDEVLAALSRGESLLTFELPVMTWLAIFDEIRGRRPRNVSALITFDAIERLNEAIDRVHAEANRMISSRDGPVSDAFE